VEFYDVESRCRVDQVKAQQLAVAVAKIEGQLQGACIIRALRQKLGVIVILSIGLYIPTSQLSPFLHIY
jgi:hypothetical protein